MKLLREITSNEDVKANFENANKLMNHYKMNSFPKAEQSAIQNYTHSSVDMNDYHWRKHKFPGNHEPKKETETKHLDSALARHTTPHDLSLYSSTRHDPRTMKNAKGIVHHPAYLSTTIHKPVAMSRDMNDSTDSNGDHHLHVLKIHAPKGSPGAYVDHISKHQGEYEHILPRGSNLKYHSTETTSKHNPWLDKKQFTHVHNMELMK
jgi:hypothetical protein